MTNQIKDGGPAFPEVVTHFYYHHDSGERYPNTHSVGGMTLRDYFAAKALNGLLSDSETMGNISKDAKGLNVNPAIYISSAAYEFADAMLNAREVSHD